MNRKILNTLKYIESWLCVDCEGDNYRLFSTDGKVRIKVGKIGIDFNLFSKNNLLFNV
jgi:hypothetical protein